MGTPLSFWPAFWIIAITPLCKEETIMGLFIREDPSYNEDIRQTGFNRYKQLLSLRFAQWWKVGMITLAGLAPLAAGIACAILTSSVLVLIPCSILGGMIAGPFLAGLYDAILRGLRDDPLPWKDAWVRSWKQDWRESLLPGAVMGLMTGLYAFMAMLFWWAQVPPSLGTVALYLFSLLLVLAANTLLWPQLVLFRQDPSTRLRNAVLFLVKRPWRVMGAGLVQLAYLAILVLFAPWTVLLLPITGVWYVVFLSQLLIYGALNEDLHIEESFEERSPTDRSEHFSDG